MMESHLWLADGKDSAADPDFSLVLSRFLTFKGILFLAGRCRHASTALKSWFIVFSTGVVVNATAGGAGQEFEFDTYVEIPPEANFEIKLGFELANGVKLIIAAPAPEKSDESFNRVCATLEKLVPSIEPTGRALEVGSRVRWGGALDLAQALMRGLLPQGMGYTGLDLNPGENVDVVGDAHFLSRYFARETFDLVYSFAVFEHLLMPWKAAVEMNHIMKVGALGYILAPQTFPVHDQPWDFWRFTDRAWLGIFNRFTGFEIIDAGLGARAHVGAEYMGMVTYRMDDVPAYLLSNVLFRKTGPSLVDWPADPAELTGSTYPY